MFKIKGPRSAKNAFPLISAWKNYIKISQHVALLLNLGVLKKLSAGFGRGGNCPLPPWLATTLDKVLSLPFVLLRTETNTFISFVLHRKMCITEVYKQFNRSLIIFVVHRNCLSLRFFFPAFFLFWLRFSLFTWRQNIEIYNEARRFYSSCVCKSAMTHAWIYQGDIAVFWGYSEIFASPPKELCRGNQE